MPVLSAEARTAESYLAGIGATGALIASGFVAFILLVGAVTFDSWPRPAGLFDGRDGQVSLKAPSAPAAEPAPTRVPNVGRILGERAERQAVAVTAVARGTGGPYGTPGGQGTLGGGPSPTPGGTTEELPPVTEPGPPPPAQGEPTAVVKGAASAVGNTVEGTTNSVGDTLGGNSSPGLGGVVGGLGRAVNSTVQGLVGGK